MSQSLRKSGQFLRNYCAFAAVGGIKKSQSLRKSGQFLLRLPNFLLFCSVNIPFPQTLEQNFIFIIITPFKSPYHSLQPIEIIILFIPPQTSFTSKPIYPSKTSGYYNPRFSLRGRQRTEVRSQKSEFRRQHFGKNDYSSAISF